DFSGRSRSRELPFHLAVVVKRYNWLCHAYCLMDNHYHFLVETPDDNLSIGMRQLNGAFTQKCNQRYKDVVISFKAVSKRSLLTKTITFSNSAGMSFSTRCGLGLS